MKPNLFLIIIVLCAMKSFSQTQWTYTTTPVLAYDTVWGAYGQPSCIYYNDTLRMYYGVASFVSGDTVPRGRIHYAWSVDGINWTKYAGNPVLNIGSPGQWDDEWLDTPEILWDDNEFKLYYYGDSVYMTGAVNASIGLATSQDGINWTKQGIVLQKGNADDWDGNFIESPALYHDPSSGVYALWYSAQDTVGWIKIGLAVSADGVNWIKDTANPCLENGVFNSWDDMFVAMPSVIRSEGVFEMWYSGVKWATQYDSVRVGYAVSLNGKDWIKYPGNPVLYALPGDSSEFVAVDVVWDSLNNEYKMWYENKNTTGTHAIFYTTSPRNILFSPTCITSINNDTTITQSDTISLSATGGNFYQWYPSEGLNNPNIANPIASPDTTIQYRVLIVSNTCITVDSVLITVLPTSVNEQNQIEQNLVNVYPNPFSETTTIEIASWKNQNYTLTIFDLFGREIIKYKIQNQKTEISRKNLPNGMYFYQVNDG
ncbi:MAG: T9SS type A sorting domain-containing protein, partial [Bacteroidota bacterium]